MEKDSMKELTISKHEMNLKRYIEMAISFFLISILFFLLIILALKSDIRTEELLGNPFPIVMVSANMTVVIFHIYCICSKKITADKYYSIIGILALFICNAVLGFTTFSYLNTFRLDEFLMLLLGGGLLKYILSHLALFINNIRESRVSS